VLTIQPEHWCGKIRISDEEGFLGLNKHIAMSRFNYDLYGAEAIKNGIVSIKIEKDTAKLKKEKLITYNDTTCFAVNRNTINNGDLILSNGPSVWIVLSGRGIIIGENYYKEIKQGNYFYLPFIAQNKFKVISDEEIVLIVCLPSKQEYDS